LLWLAGNALQDGPELHPLVRVADLALAGAIVALTAWLRILHPVPGLLRGPAYAWQVRIAWLGLIVYATALAIIAALPGDAGLYPAGAVRHIVLLGFMAPLMVAMSHIVLARFGTGFESQTRLLTVAFALLTVAWPLRVGPALVGDAPGEAGRVVMGIAGLLAIAAFALAAVACLRVALAVVRPASVVLRLPRAG
jgi:hypothetical protein